MLTDIMYSPKTSSYITLMQRVGFESRVPLASGLINFKDGIDSRIKSIIRDISKELNFKKSTSK